MRDLQSKRWIVAKGMMPLSSPRRSSRFGRRGELPLDQLSCGGTPGKGNLGGGRDGAAPELAGQ